MDGKVYRKCPKPGNLGLNREDVTLRGIRRSLLKSFVLFFVVVQVFCCAVPVRSREVSYRLDEVVVATSRVEIPLGEAPANAKVTAAEEIRKNLAETLVDVSKREPGVFFSQNLLGNPKTLRKGHPKLYGHPGVELKDRMVESLSTGKRRLVFIARAVAREPKLLLVDERTIHLDITHQIKVMDLMKELSREKELRILVAFHDLSLASQYCDRLLLLDKGALRTDGIPKSVLTYRIIDEVHKTLVLERENPVSRKAYICPVPEVDKRYT
jgi:ABC-type uncharacterized transport system ATPase subunit